MIPILRHTLSYSQLTISIISIETNFHKDIGNICQQGMPEKYHCYMLMERGRENSGMMTSVSLQESTSTPRYTHQSIDIMGSHSHILIGPSPTSESSLMSRPSQIWLISCKKLTNNLNPRNGLSWEDHTQEQWLHGSNSSIRILLWEQSHLVVS